MSLPWFFSCNIIQAHIRSNSSRSFFYNLPLRFPNSLCINFLLTSESLFLRALSRGVSIYLNLYTNNPFCRFCSQRRVFIKEMLQHFLICFATQILLYCISCLHFLVLQCTGHLYVYMVLPKVWTWHGNWNDVVPCAALVREKLPHKSLGDASLGLTDRQGRAEEPSVCSSHV